MKTLPLFLVPKDRSTDLSRQVEGLALRLEGRKPFPIGTVRDWKGGKVIKTANGWEPMPEKPLGASKKPDEAPVGGGTGVSPVAAPKKSARQRADFAPKALADALTGFLSNPENSEAQAAVRENLRTLCGDFGMMSREKGATKLWNKFSLFEPKKGLPEGMFGWDSVITVKAKIPPRAKDMMEAVAQGKAPATWPLKAARGMHTLVHEAVHGHSPIRQEQFKGRYRLLEEATTELAARKVLRDAFGVSWQSFGAKGAAKDAAATTPTKLGAYNEFCGALTAGVQAALKRRGVPCPEDGSEDWYDFVGEAAIEMRRKPPPTDPDKWAYLKRFASSLPVSSADLEKGGGVEAVSKEVAAAVWLALKPAREKEKLMSAVAGLGAAGFVDLSDPKSMPKEVALALKPFIDGLEKANKDWSSYSEGGSLPESKMRQIQEEDGQDLIRSLEGEDSGTLPRNNLPRAIAYARVLSAYGELTPSVLRDLALLQDDALDAAYALADAVDRFGLEVVEEPPVTVNGLVF